jgi:flagellar M-ring protein FliF
MAAGTGGNVSRRSETIAFQTSKTVRRMRLPQGAIRRFSASVLVDQGVRWEGSGASQKKVLTPPSPDTVRAIRVLVSGALGLQPDRGDQLVVESLPFETTLQIPPPEVLTPVTPGKRLRFGLETWMVAAAAGGIVVLGLIFVAVKKKRSKRRINVRTNVAVGAGDTAKALASKPTDQATAIQDSVEPSLLELAPEAAKMDRLIKSVRTTVASEPAIVAGVLRNWLEER